MTLNTQQEAERSGVTLRETIATTELQLLENKNAALVPTLESTINSASSSAAILQSNSSQSAVSVTTSLFTTTTTTATTTTTVKAAFYFYLTNL
jgi:hypothetical protein